MYVALPYCQCSLSSTSNIFDICHSNSTGERRILVLLFSTTSSFALALYLAVLQTNRHLLMAKCIKLLLLCFVEAYHFNSSITIHYFYFEGLRGNTDTITGPVVAFGLVDLILSGDSGIGWSCGLDCFLALGLEKPKTFLPLETVKIRTHMQVGTEWWWYLWYHLVISHCTYVLLHLILIPFVLLMSVPACFTTTVLQLTCFCNPMLAP